MSAARPLAEVVADLHNDEWNVELAEAHGLKIVPVSWEDTRRKQMSCVGPNICDMTLACEGKLMPMIRKPNRTDLTVDIPMSKFFVTVGNEQQHNAAARRIPLREYIEQLGIYNGRTYNTESDQLLLPRDEHVLAAAQACLLPLAPAANGSSAQVEFVPQLYSYQAEEHKPTVLTIVATTHGTSAQIVHLEDQPLYFNRGGVATKFTAKNIPESPTRQPGTMTAEDREDQRIMIFQIPLLPEGLVRGSSESAGIRDAMIQPSMRPQGRFNGLESIKLIRDMKGPIRLTVQIYKVTDSGKIQHSEMQDIAESIKNIHDHGIAAPSPLCMGPSSRSTASGLPPVREISAPADRGAQPMLA